MNRTLTCWFVYNDGRAPSQPQQVDPGEAFSDLLDVLNGDMTINYMNVILLDGRTAHVRRTVDNRAVARIG